MRSRIPKDWTHEALGAIRAGELSVIHAPRSHGKSGYGITARIIAEWARKREWKSKIPEIRFVDYIDKIWV